MEEQYGNISCFPYNLSYPKFKIIIVNQSKHQWKKDFLIIAGCGSTVWQ